MTFLIGYFNTSFETLKKHFGTPSSGDKVSTEWVLHTLGGIEFYLYDYKETDEYDQDLPSVESFRAMRSYDWHIGASHHEYLPRIIKYLELELERYTDGSETLEIGASALFVPDDTK
jgi:hypothetical protein